MRANPGGQIPPSEVIGRAQLIERLWTVLGRQSLVLSAERRMGKTCVVRKMQAGPPADMLPIYRDLEGIGTTLEFVRTVFDDVERYLGRLARTAEKARRLLDRLSGGKVGEVEFPPSAAREWKPLLTSTIEDLIEHQDRRVVLFWDEVPLMLHNLIRREGEPAAMEVLDTLRSLRQMHPDLRMAFSGSIGMHQVINLLRRKGYANSPTNDMQTVNVPALSPDDGRHLARLLLQGEGIETDDVDATARAVTDAVDHIPHYIHHVVDQMATRGGAANADTARVIVTDCLIDPQDVWDMGHYRRRVDTYYDETEEPLALSLLDVVAGSKGPLSFEDAFNLLKSQTETEDDELARHVLTLLQRDHYLVQDADGKYSFAYPLINRSWRLQRGLPA